MYEDHSQGKNKVCRKTILRWFDQQRYFTCGAIVSACLLECIVRIG